jgi:hypothetical protein
MVITSESAIADRVFALREMVCGCVSRWVSLRSTHPADYGLSRSDRLLGFARHDDGTGERGIRARNNPLKPTR